MICSGSKILLLATLIVAFPFAFAVDIGISPPRVELTGLPGETVSTNVSIITGPGLPQQINVDESDFTLDEHGSLLLLNAGTGDHGAGAWIMPETDAFEIAGDTARPFRIAVTIPDDRALAGTYAGIVFFAVVPDVQSGQGVGVVTTTRIAFVVYVTVAGTETTGSSLLDMYQDGDKGLTLTVRNDGNTIMRLGGHVELRDESGTVQYTLPIDDLAVLRESERDVSLALPDDVQPGFYVALALVEDSRGGLLTGQAQLDVP